jgi:hypothetical protein
MDAQDPVFPLFPAAAATRPRPYLVAASGASSATRQLGWPAIASKQQTPVPPAMPSAVRSAGAERAGSDGILGLSGSVDDSGLFDGDHASNDDADEDVLIAGPGPAESADNLSLAGATVGSITASTVSTAAPVSASPTVPSSVEAFAGLIAVQDDLMARARVEIVELALHVARHVIGEHVAWGAFDLQPVIEDALRQLGEALEVVVRVGPRQHAAVAAALESMEGVHHARVVLDETLGAGDVVIVSDGGTVDGRLEHRLSAIAHAVRTSVGGGDRA